MGARGSQGEHGFDGRELESEGVEAVGREGEA